MSGIFGSTMSLEDATIEAVHQLLTHRGPDDWQVETVTQGARPLTLAHARHAVQDPTPFGRQPMKSLDGKWLINFNGEIYNHFSLRDRVDLEFRGSSDTESMLEYLARFGVDDTLAVLNGMFAFAAVNRETSELILARDPFGIRPLYFAKHDNHFSFASEIKPLLAIGVGGSMDAEALAAFLSLRYVPSPRTLHAGISKVPPGHFLQVDLETLNVETHCYVRPTAQSFQGSTEDAVAMYHRQLEETVRRQMVSDKRIGILLSGGIDSALIAAMAKNFNRGITGFTVGFGKDYPESEIEDAATTAEVLGIRHEHVTVTPDNLRSSLDDIARCLEEPLGTTSIMPMWHLTDLAAEKSSVVLTGHGNDEPWGGYRRYQIELLIARYPILRNGMFNLPGTLSRLPVSDGLKRGFDCLGKGDTAERFQAAYSLFTPAEISRLIQGPGAEVALESIAYWLDWLDDIDMPDPDRMMRLDARMGLADDLLLYNDKLAMARTVETRVPMLDPDLVRLIESLPLDMRTSLRETKIVHRMMASKYLPEDIINRPKKGFQLPFGKWSRGIWQDLVAERLVAGGLKLHDHVDRHFVEELWRQHSKGLPDRSRQVFSLMMLSGWCETFL